LIRGSSVAKCERARSDVEESRVEGFEGCILGLWL
jgi:hypothetical protein